MAVQSAEGRTSRTIALILLAIAGVAGPGSASEFRSIKPIPTPGGGATRSAGFVPVRPRIVQQAVQGLMRAWNTPELRDWLGDAYYDKARLLDAIDTTVARDARLRVLAIESIETVQQTTRPAPAGGRATLVSVVAVVVTTALEFNDPVAGFQRREGTNEYLFEVTEAVR